MRIRRSQWACVLVAFAASLTASRVMSQEVYCLSLLSAGSATVTLDRGTKTAYIDDGGRDGSGGIRDAKIDQQGILAFLLDQHVENLVVTCSHPHADHIGGLVEMLADDPQILRFTNIAIVDNGFDETGTKSVSLADVLRTRLDKNKVEYGFTSKGFDGAGPDRPTPKGGISVVHASARNRDAYRTIPFLKQDNVKVGNWIYAPVPGDRSEHGRPVVTWKVLSLNGKSLCVVDMDDAGKQLIERYVKDLAKPESNARAPKVLLLPHHGSSGSDVSAFLDLPPDQRPIQAIVSVNERNQYHHPKPAVLAKCLEVLGRRNVHFTGSRGNILVGEDGTLTARTDDDVRRDYFLFVDPHAQRVEVELAELEERSLLENRLIAADRKALLKHRADYDKVRRLMLGEPEREALVFGDNPPGSPGGGGPEPALPPRSPPKQPPGGQTPATEDPYGLLNEKVKRRESEGVERLKPGTERRLERFRTTRDVPDFGGIVIGNRTSDRSSRITSAKIEYINGHARITVRTDAPSGRSEHRYEAITATELWCAYHLLRTTREMITAGARPDEVNILGETATNGNVTWYGVHPSLRDTLVARDSMRLDTLGALESKPEEPANKRWKECSWHVEFGRNWAALQWYDEEAVVTASDGVIYVRASQGPPDFLMRCKFWQAPKFYREAGEPKKRDEALGERYVEYFKRLLAKQDPESKTRVEDALVDEEKLERIRLKTNEEAKNDKAKASLLYQQAVQKAELDKTDSYRVEQIEALGRKEQAKRLGFPVDGEFSGGLLSDAVSVAVDRKIRESGLGESGAYRLWLLKQSALKQLQDEFSSGSPVYLQEGPLRKIYDGFDAFRRVDRFAKIVAVLHWIEQQLGTEKLPTLPGEIAPLRGKSNQFLSLDQVLSD